MPPLPSARHASPSRLPSPVRRPSNLSPAAAHIRAAPPVAHPSHAASAPSSSSSSSSTIATHLANLDRVLAKPPLHPPPPQEQIRSKSTAEAGSKPPQQHPEQPNILRIGLLNALNLPSFFPFASKTNAGGADEMMSPRSLRHLQLLLSADGSRASPKSTIAYRWKDLHGESSWDGLLEPLDADLRRELLRYGDFVQAAYHAFHSMPSTPKRHRGLILPDRSYRPTRSLFASSSLSLPEWAHPSNAAPWLTERTNWIGYVAVCDSEREIVRMGRRDIVIVLRGTATCLEWAENLRATLVPLSGEDSPAAGDDADEAKVARGFLSLYKTAGDSTPSLSSIVMDEVQRLMEYYKGEELSITVVGHSLGAALALLVADEIKTTIPKAPPVAVMSFGGPKVGNRAFADRLSSPASGACAGNRASVLRVVNEGDFVPRVPGLARRREGYAHAGRELRVDSRQSPCLRPDSSPACSHDLEAYLHLVDGFTAKGEPFRPGARRSVGRLLQLQKDNLKPVYVSRAQELAVPSPIAPPSPVVGPVYALPSPVPGR